MITIYGRANSINVRKVLWLCEDIGLAFERLDYGRGFQDPNVPEITRHNPNALVPTIVDGDVGVWESNTILRYLAAKYGPPELYPSDLVERSHVDRWMDWQLSAFYPAFHPLFFGLFLKHPDFDKPELLESARERGAQQMALLTGQLETTGAYVAGPDCTIADMAVGPGVHRWFTLVPDYERPAALEAYYERLSERPGYAKFVRIEAP